jgi:hypothetical protein
MNNDTNININNYKDNDIENQFCIIDEVDNIIQNNQIELMNMDNNNSSKMKIFRKSKSLPDRITYNLLKNDFDSCKKKRSTVSIYNHSNSCNLIKNKSMVGICIYRFKKICNYFKYCCFCNLSKINKIEVLNKFLTICLHVFIMVIFEIYFYFNYIVQIEKNEFLNQIDKYFGELNNIPIDPIQKQAIKYIIDSNNSKYNTYLSYLYDQYINSLSSQKKLLQKLLIKACTIAGIIGIIGIILFTIGLFNRKKIKWNWIWIENLLMFLFLGIFEYFFFMTIVMNYNPITDAEVKYYMVDGIITYFNSTNY